MPLHGGLGSWPIGSLAYVDYQPFNTACSKQQQQHRHQQQPHHHHHLGGDGGGGGGGGGGGSGMYLLGITMSKNSRRRRALRSFAHA